MNEINTLAELAELFRNGILKKAEYDIVIFDKGKYELTTDKSYSFRMDCCDIAWAALDTLDIPTNELEAKCMCDKCEWEKHTCPFQEDVNDNHELYCYCCPYCEYQCRMDI